MAIAWSTHTARSAAGHRLLVKGGTLHAIPDEVRLLNPAGQPIARGPARSLPDGDAGLCGTPQGLTGAELALPDTDVQRFRGGQWPPGYRLEMRVGGRWRPASPRYAGCETAE